MAPLLQRAWELLPPMERKLGAAEILGPVGLIQQEAKSLSWRWDQSPWAFEREGAEAVPLVGGPNGAYAHAVREAVRQRELRKAITRRPELEGAQMVDRRAVFRVLKWGAKRNQDIPGYHRGIIKSVVTGASTFQVHLHAAGLADSDRCPFCGLDEPEDAPHVFWRCPAWKEERARFLKLERVEVGHLPPITQYCGLLTEPPEAGAMSQ